MFSTVLVVYSYKGTKIKWRYSNSKWTKKHRINSRGEFRLLNYGKNSTIPLLNLIFSISTILKKTTALVLQLNHVVYQQYCTPITNHESKKNFHQSLNSINLIVLSIYLNSQKQPCLLSTTGFFSKGHMRTLKNSQFSLKTTEIRPKQHEEKSRKLWVNVLTSQLVRVNSTTGQHRFQGQYQT